MVGLIKAFRLEIKHIKQSKIQLPLLLVLPTLIIVAFALAGKDTIFSPSRGLSFYDYFAPSIYSTAIVFITTQMTVLRIVAERSPYGTLDRDLLAISRPSMYLGKYFANLMIAIVQCSLIFYVGYNIYGVKIVGDPWAVLLIMMFAALFGLSLGLLISVITKTRDQAVQLVPFSVLVFLVLSGIMIPIDKMPSDLALIASNLPLTLLNNALESIMHSGKSLEETMTYNIRLFGWIIGFLSLGIIKFSSEKYSS